MPIEFRIDHERRLVIARALAILKCQDVFEYQRTVWQRQDLFGYDELFDMSEAANIEDVSLDQIMQLAQLAAALDAIAPPSKVAIVAPGDLAFGLGRMYQTHRAMEGSGCTRVGVFRSKEDALAFLGVASIMAFPAD